MAYRKDGFTLIELSIVLIIIGLIIGGVLVGQDMIKSAEIRATIQQIEKYNTAVNTFRGKYGGLPGDLTAQKAASYGMVVRSGSAGRGDGNDLLESCAPTGIAGGCETLIFWRDLSFANLTEGSFTSAVDNFAKNGATVLPAEVPLYLPQVKIGRGNFFTVFGSAGINYYQLTGVNRILNSGVYMTGRNITPGEAFSIDDKVDDGMPMTGIVLAMDDAGNDELNIPAIPDTPAVGVCVSDAIMPNPYNTSTSDYANSPACQLSIRFN